MIESHGFTLVTRRLIDPPPLLLGKNKSCYESKRKMIERSSIPAGIYLLKVDNRNTRTRREISSKLTIKTQETLKHIS